MRLVVVSNRVTWPDGATKPGGMAVGIEAVLKTYRGVWIGWSGRCSGDDGVRARHRLVRNGIEYITLDLPCEEFHGYYSGFSNQVLWPAFHGRQDLLAPSPSDYRDYLTINEIFADELSRTLRPDDLIWIHDYHLIPLGHILRRRGIRNRIGFFLHTPFSKPATLTPLPMAADIAAFLCAYDLLGFQTPTDRQAWKDFLNAQTFPGTSRLTRRTFPPRSAVMPIGIDTAEFEEAARKNRIDDRQLLRVFDHLPVGVTPIIAVDRLDYSKGLAERCTAFDAFLKEYPSFEGQVSLIQVAPDGRQDIPAYRDEKMRVERAFSRLRAAHPERQVAHLLTDAIDRSSLAAAYRRCRVGLVTPLRDGMNLVAKEYVAAQNPANPGALILSRFAGAARELETGAILVDPFDITAVAAAIKRALTITRTERIWRWETMIKSLRRNNAAQWAKRFIETLQSDEVAHLGTSVTTISGRTKDQRKPTVPAGARPALAPPRYGSGRPT